MGKQKLKVIEPEFFQITRNGDCVGIGLSYDDAVKIADEYQTAYPLDAYNVLSTPKGKKVNP
jgi:hypothetical protein